MTTDNYIFKEFREHVPVTREWAYLETASTGLVPDYVYEGTRRYIDDRYLKGGDSVWMYEDGSTWTLPMIERSKAALAAMIHCAPDEIAFGQSSTQLFTMVTEAIDYATNDNVVSVQKGWIGNRYAWQKRESEGLEVRFAYPVNGEVSADSVIALCDEHTRAITVNLVESSTGYRIDIDKLGDFCHKNNILLFVDAVQALGVLKVDVKKSNIDFMVGTDYKWMMNFCGTGFAYISPKVQPLIKHWGAGWMSDSDRFNTSKDHLELRSDAGRFEIGHQHNDGIYGLGLAAEKYCKIGEARIQEYVCGLSEYYRKSVQETPGIRLKYEFAPENRSQIVVVEIPAGIEISNEDFRSAKVFAHLKEAGENGNREIRLSFHFYNNEEDADRFLEVIRTAVSKSK